MPQNENHISEEEFLLEFFGLNGRILGNPPYTGRKRYFTDDPNSIFECMKFAEANKLPAFISVQPFSDYGVVKGIEKLFFDFDYGKKSDDLTIEQIEDLKAQLDNEVKRFVYGLSEIKNPKINPMVVKTNKGYHVYIYLDKIYEFSDSQEFVKEVYKVLMQSIKIYGNVSFLDPTIDEDIVRLSRIPFSVHQASGKKCMLLKLNNKREFEEEKLRGLEIYKDKGLKYNDVIKAAKQAIQNIESEAKEREVIKTQIATGQLSQGGGEIRPCYLKSLKGKEMEHLKRLSLLGEAWYSGLRDEKSLVQLFANMNDFDLNKTRYYVNYFINGKNYLKYPPYRCETMKKLGWCLESNECPIWRKNYE